MSDDGPVLDQVSLVVKDMEASVAFYRLLGLKIPDTVPAFQQHHRSAGRDRHREGNAGGVDLDFDSQEFARHWDRGWQGAAAVIGFRVASRDEVDAVYGRLTAAGYEGQQEPYDAFWGARYAIVADPGGNPVGLMSPADPDRRAAPDFP